MLVPSLALAAVADVTLADVDAVEVSTDDDVAADDIAAVITELVVIPPDVVPAADAEPSVPILLAVTVPLLPVLAFVALSPVLSDSAGVEQPARPVRLTSTISQAARRSDTAQ